MTADKNKIFLLIGYNGYKPKIYCWRVHTGNLLSLHLLFKAYKNNIICYKWAHTWDYEAVDEGSKDKRTILQENKYTNKVFCKQTEIWALPPIRPIPWVHLCL